MNKENLTKFLEKLDYGPAPEAADKVLAWLDSHKRKFNHSIEGIWWPPNKGRYLSSINPSTGEIITEFAYGTAEDVEAAMAAAKSSFSNWSRFSGYERAKYLYAIARAIAKNARLFAVLESIDNGKPIRETRDVDIPLIIRHFYYFAGWAEIIKDEYPNFKPGGVVAQIVPWNFPLLIATWKIAPAIAAGNTVVLKPSKSTSLSVLLLADILMNDVKLPAGVVNIVTGDSKTGDLIVKHHIPWKISFTGSTEIGASIRKLTAGSGKHITLELGGKSPFIVFANADIDSAIEGVVNAIWFNQGQVCCAGSRLLVEENIYEEFIRRLKVRMEKLRTGSPLDKAIDIGAINSASHLETIKKFVEIGQKEGGTMWQPSNWRQPEKGYYFPPTIFTNVQPSHTIVQEEIFGPVLVCMSFRTPKEAVQLANNTRYGLGASVWSQDIDTALDVARQIKAGTVWINNHNLFDAASEFGGYRESGYGREAGRGGIFEVMKEQFPPFNDSYPIDVPEMTKYLTVSYEIDRTYRFLIGGKLVRPDRQISIGITAPSGEVIGFVGDANRKDVRNAVEAARNAAESWENQSAHFRAQILYFLAENLAIHKERFAKIISKQTDKPLGKSRKEVEKSLERLFRYAALTDKFEGTVQPVPARMLVVALKEPIGVIGIRAPDKFPLLGVISTLAPAIAMGNTVVLVAGKRALSVMDLIQVIQNSDVPAGVINILTAANPDAIAKILAEHENVDSVWFFGSNEGSAAVEAASVSNMKRTWVSNGQPFDWMSLQGQSLRFLREATQIKDIWVPYGV